VYDGISSLVSSICNPNVDAFLLDLLEPFVLEFYCLTINLCGE
jgi:hypothetical protein